MHIFIMSKMRHSHRQYETRGRCGTKPGPSRGKLVPAAPTFLASRLEFGVFSKTVSYTCQGRSVMPKVGAARILGRPTTLASQPG
jgi:hypothetical protein